MTDSTTMTTMGNGRGHSLHMRALHIKPCTSTDNWATPSDMYAALNQEFSFTLDPCPLNGADGLSSSWAGKRVYCNPPYSDITPWLAKHIEAELAVYLLPSRTGNGWFHDIVLPRAKEIRFVRGRIRFGGSKVNAPFDSLIAIFEQVAR